MLKKYIFFPFEVFKSQGFVKELNGYSWFHRISWMALFSICCRYKVNITQCYTGLFDIKL